MNRLVFTLLFAVLFFKNEIDGANTQNAKNEDVGSPLFLTKLIDEGKVLEAREQAIVRHPEINKIYKRDNYAGYITINKTYNSNLFFWFFPSQTKPATDPVLIWLNGGPAITVFFALFDYSGPLVVQSNQKLKLRDHSFTRNHSVIYLENPLGTGYSFTDHDAGYPRSLEENTDQIIEFLRQFRTLFPEYCRNGFYTGGDSYAAKYAITIAKAIRAANKELEINLQGIVIGNGIIDYSIQSNQAEFLYSSGLIDFNDRDQLRYIENQLYVLYRKRYYAKWGVTLSPKEARKKYFELNDVKSDLILNTTGYVFYATILRTNLSSETLTFFQFAQRADVRKAIHVGNYSFVSNGEYPRSLLPRDPYAEVKKDLQKLMDQYRVIIYHGELDMEFPYISTVDMIRNLAWSGGAAYQNAKRHIWRVGGEIAGYWKKVKNFNEVLIRNAGHVATLDQLPWVNDMLIKFTRGWSP